jgi:hypothetical protein
MSSRALEPESSSAPTFGAAANYRFPGDNDDLSSSGDEQTHERSQFHTPESALSAHRSPVQLQQFRQDSAAKEKSKRATGECVTDDWDVGVRWVVRKDKMVVAGFAPGCLAHPSHAKPCACAAKKPTWASTL